MVHCLPLVMKAECKKIMACPTDKEKLYWNTACIM
jgi:hypothetical protein